MAERAACCGAEYSLKTCITQINPQKKTLFLTGVRGRTELSYNILIAADGPRSVIARGLAIAPPRYVYAGIQAEVSWDGCQDLVELHPNASPDFFAWMIPLSSTRARIGLCSMHHAPEHFAAFAEQFGPSRVHEMTGTIPLGVRNRTYGSGCLIAGDAAGFPKPISGGGVYTGIRSARHAAVTAIAAAECGDVSDASLATYERLWRADFGQELDLGLKALSLRRSLNQSEIDATIDALNHPDILELIIRTGDMDHPSVLLRKLLTKPKLISSFGLLGIKSMMRRICLCCRS
jgi:flavin-dependent dehydrogenase